MVAISDIEMPEPIEVEVHIALDFRVPYRHLPTLVSQLLGTLPLNVTVEMQVNEP